MNSSHGDGGLPRRVSPFGYPRINACLRLPVAFRSLPRPSSAISAKASALCSYLLNLFSETPLHPRNLLAFASCFRSPLSLARSAPPGRPAPLPSSENGEISRLQCPCFFLCSFQGATSSRLTARFLSLRFQQPCFRSCFRFRSASLFPL